VGWAESSRPTGTLRALVGLEDSAHPTLPGRMTDAAHHYPDKLAIEPLARPPQATARVPGSKSITNPALALAALVGQRACPLGGALVSEDTEVMLEALRRLGFTVHFDRSPSGPVFRVFPPAPGKRIPADRAELFVGNSGTTMRFLTAMLCLGNGTYR